MPRPPVTKIRSGCPVELPLNSLNDEFPRPVFFRDIDTPDVKSEIQIRGTCTAASFARILYFSLFPTSIQNDLFRVHQEKLVKSKSCKGHIA